MKNRSLLHLFLLCGACLLLPLAAHAASFPYITLNQHTNRLSDNGSALTLNGSPIGGANWTADGTTNSTLAGVASAGAVVVTNQSRFLLTPVESKLLIGNGQASGQWGDVPFSYSPGPVTIDSILTNAQTDTEFSFAGLSVSFTFHSLTNQLSPGYVTDLSAVWGQLLISDTDTNAYGDLGAFQGNVSNYGTGSFLGLLGIQGYAYNGSTAQGEDMIGGFFTALNSGGGTVTNLYGIKVATVQTSGGSVSGNAYGIYTPVPTGAAGNNIGILIGTAPTNTTAAIYQSGGNTNYFSGSLTTDSTYTSGAPSGGTAAAWKLGSWKTNAVTMIATNYIEVEIGGVLRKLAVVQ